MSTQAMGSQGGGRQQSQFGNSPRQGSMYNLTLNEVQSQLGEPLDSMNLDELLRNVLPVEGDQPLELDLENTSAKLASVSGIQRQGSLTLTRELSKKTVNEVWKDIQQGHDRSTGERAPAQERQPTLGEMTLEDFLLKAGIVADTDGFDKTRTDNIDNMGSSGSNGLMTGASVYPQGVHWLKQCQQMPALQQYQPMPALQQHQVQQPMVGAYVPGHPVQQPSVVGTSSMLECGYTESSSPMMGTFSDSQTPSRKRNASGDIVEKTVERRQKRMIKNRESAARSRARKQAYTNELENKVSRLEEENEKLKKQKELDKILYSAPPPNPKFQLRRTSSSPM